MPSFISISARVQELFRKNRGGETSPRQLRVNMSTLTLGTVDVET